MPDPGFGGASDIVSWSGSGNIFSDGIPLPIGRLMPNGSQACLITEIEGYARGRGAPRAGRLQLGSAITNPFTIPAGTSAQPTGRGPHAQTGHWLVQGGTARFSLLFAGLTYFGRGGAGSTNDGGGRILPGMLGGGYHYAQAPSPSNISSVVSINEGTAARVSYVGTPGGDDGGIGLLAYKVQRASNSAFTSEVSTVSTPLNPVTITGLTPGKQYWWRVTAVNEVTNAAGAIGGPWGNVVTAVQEQPGLGGRIRVGSSNVPLDGRIRNVANTAWVELDGRIRTADNTNWVPFGL